MTPCHWCGGVATGVTTAGPDASRGAVTIHDCDPCADRSYQEVRRYPYWRTAHLTTRPAPRRRRPPANGQDANLFDFLPEKEEQT